MKQILNRKFLVSNCYIKSNHSCFKVTIPNNLNIKYFDYLNKHNFSSSNKFKSYNKKDYYLTLGIKKTATLDEIKSAYRKLAKIYHPDVRTKPLTNIKDIEFKKKLLEKFREIAEAYAVLSNLKSKTKYDQTLEPNPKNIYNSEKLKNMNDSKQERDSLGNKIFKTNVNNDPLNRDDLINREININYYKDLNSQISNIDLKLNNNLSNSEIYPGSYGDYQLEKVKKFRKEYNFDSLGNYKGGVPRPYKGSIRGNALDSPLKPHSDFDHNENFADFVGVKPLNSFDVIQHKLFHFNQKEQNQRFKPYFNIQKMDQDWQYRQTSEYRKLLIFPLIFIIAYSLLNFYKKALERKNRFKFALYTKKLKHYEFKQIGPITIKANRFENEKKYLTRREYHQWLENSLK